MYNRIIFGMRTDSLNTRFIYVSYMTSTHDLKVILQGFYVPTLCTRHMKMDTEFSICGIIVDTQNF